jgi:serine protease Do
MPSVVSNPPPTSCGKCFPLLVLLWSAHCTLFTGVCPADDPVLAAPADLPAVVARCEGAVVALARVVATPAAPLPPRYDPFEALGKLDAGPVPDGLGTGVIVQIEDERRLLILTNQHLITSQLEPQDALEEHLFVRTVQGHTLTAKVRAYDPRSDLAVLVAELKDLTAADLNIQPLSIGAAEAAAKGSFVIVLGNPFGLARDGSASVQTGIISNRQRAPAPLPGQESIQSPATIHQLGTLFQLDLRLSPGMSGAAVCNRQGELIGLTTMLPALQGDPTAAAFAVPMTPEIRRIVATLLRGEEVEYGFLGIDPEDSDPLDLAAARPEIIQARCAAVARVSRRSPAELAGLLSGDLIYQIDREVIRSRTDLVRVVGLLGPGQAAQLHVFRPRTRERLVLTAVLAKWPLYDDRRLIATRPTFVPWAGLSLDYATGRVRYLPDSFLATFPQGVMITQVLRDSPAAESGLQPGVLITRVAGEPVRSPSEFLQRVQVLEGPVELETSLGNRFTVQPEP